jgi:hypothetical protein
LTIKLPKSAHYVYAVGSDRFERLTLRSNICGLKETKGYSAMVGLTEIRDRLMWPFRADKATVRKSLRANNRIRPAIIRITGCASVRPLLSGYSTATVAQHLITGSGARLAVPRGLVAAA